jgi:hypothetical protein
MQVHEKISDADIELSPTRISIGGQMQAVVEGGFFTNNGVSAVGINDPSAAFGLDVSPQVAERLMKGLRATPDPDSAATPTIHRQQSVSPLDLAEPDEYMHTWLKNHEFYDCEITGPVVFWFPGDHRFTDCRFTRDQMWEIDGDRPYRGAIAINNCIFERCTFRGDVGIAAPAELLDQFGDWRWNASRVERQENLGR